MPDHAHGGHVDIILQYFDGCPSWRSAEARLREALREVGSAVLGARPRA